MADEETTTSDGGAEDARTLLTAALIGAAIGAGLGLLASRAMTEDTLTEAAQRSARRTRKALARRSKAVRSATADSLEGAKELVGDFATRARDAFESALEREVKDLRRAARRQRRRLGL